jgi:hypothetical protein
MGASETTNRVNTAWAVIVNNQPKSTTDSKRESADRIASPKGRASLFSSTFAGTAPDFSSDFSTLQTPNPETKEAINGYLNLSQQDPWADSDGDTTPGTESGFVVDFLSKWRGQRHAEV